MKTIYKLLKITKELQKATKKQVEATQVTALIELYKIGPEGLAMNEIAKLVGVSGAASGRMVAVLSTNGSKLNTSMEGWGLVEVFYDYNRPRSNIVRLTTKGIKLMDKLIDIIEKV